MSVLFDLHSGKNAKWPYYLKAFVREAIPARRVDLERLLDRARRRPDWEQIARRVEYLCKATPADLGPDAIPWSDVRKGECSSAHYYDLRQWMRPFDPAARINFLPGDVTHIPRWPSLTKSRPIEGDNANSVIIKLGQIRHFIWVDDHIDYADKMSRAVFRGKVPGKPKRERLFEMYYGHELIDLGDSDRHGSPQWHSPRMTLFDQLRYKWILAIEGNDVASNLKWIMSSNSVAVMPRPEYETWFMEGTLIPDVHYFEVGRDFADLPDRLRWLDSHPEVARRIIAAANDYTRRFRDAKVERLVSTLVIARYLNLLPNLTPSET